MMVQRGAATTGAMTNSAGPISRVTAIRVAALIPKVQRARRLAESLITQAMLSGKKISAEPSAIKPAKINAASGPPEAAPTATMMYRTTGCTLIKMPE